MCGKIRTSRLLPVFKHYSQVLIGETDLLMHVRHNSLVWFLLCPDLDSNRIGLDALQGLIFHSYDLILGIKSLLHLPLSDRVKQIYQISKHPYMCRSGELQVICSMLRMLLWVKQLLVGLGERRKKKELTILEVFTIHILQVSLLSSSAKCQQSTILPFRKQAYGNYKFMTCLCQEMHSKLNALIK